HARRRHRRPRDKSPRHFLARGKNLHMCAAYVDNQDFFGHFIPGIVEATGSFGLTGAPVPEPFVMCATAAALPLTSATAGSIDFIHSGDATPMINAIATNGNNDICSRPPISSNRLFSSCLMGP